MPIDVSRSMSTASNSRKVRMAAGAAEASITYDICARREKEMRWDVGATHLKRQKRIVGRCDEKLLQAGPDEGLHHARDNDGGGHAEDILDVVSGGPLRCESADSLPHTKKTLTVRRSRGT